MADRSGLQMVSFDDIEVGVVENHRTDMGDIAGLAADILEKGLLQPLLVQYRHYGGNGFIRPDTGQKVFSRFMLVAGHRRHAAIKRIRAKRDDLFDKIPVVLFRGNTTDALLAQLSENIERKSMNPVELADSLRGLIVAGLSQAEIAKRTHLSPSYVSTLLGVREKCSTAVLDALAKGELTIDTALGLSKLDEPAQARQLDKYRGTKATKGKAKAKAETKKDTGGKVRPSLKAAHVFVGKVIDGLGAIGADGETRSFWRGAATAIQYAQGDTDELETMATERLEKIAKARAVAEEE